MTQPKAKEKFVITHPKNEKGEEVKHSFMLTLSLSKGHSFKEGDNVGERLLRALGKLDGIDSITPDMGRYTLGVTIARTFDYDEVIAEVKRLIEEDVLSEIVRPKLVTL